MHQAIQLLRHQILHHFQQLEESLSSMPPFTPSSVDEIFMEARRCRSSGRLDLFYQVSTTNASAR